jgi:hypothetical protein
MNARLKKRLLTGVAVAVVVAAATAAVVMAAEPSHHRHRSGTLATAAGYLGVSESRLKSELASGKSLGQIAGTTSGKSSAGLIAALEANDKQKLAAAAARVPSRVKTEVEGPLVRGTSVTALATGYLGVSRAKLRGELRSGKSLGEIADATAGKSEAGLIETLTAAKKETVASQLKAGKITRGQANEILTHLPTRVRRRVDLERSARRRSATG